MGVYEGEEERRFNMVNSLTALSRSCMALDKGLDDVDLGNYGGSKGIKDLVDRGYATKTYTEVSKGLSVDYYRLTNGGKRVLDTLLKSVDLD